MPAGVVSETTLLLLTAELGPESPSPPFTGLQRLPDPSGSPDLPPEMRERIGYGRLANPLPYALQNGYSRDLRLRDIPALRLANDRLEALVLPGLGGRLWSLRDLVADRDLVFSNRQRSPTSRSPTPGSPAGSSGTSAQPATRLRRADRSSRAASRPTEPRCGSGSGSAPEIWCSQSTC